MPAFSYPQRIICLTEETTETLYLLGESDRIVGISGFTVRPARARREKPRISAFTSAKIDRILALQPDLVLGFSDLQAAIAQDLIRAGIETYIFNQRSVPDILRMMQTVGDLVGAHDKAANLVSNLEQRLEAVRVQTAAWPRRPRVFFEEWDQPLISGIRWVSELIGIAGGDDIFPALAAEPLAKNRIITDPAAVIEQAPDLIIASWCGKKVRPEQIAARPGWSTIPAVQHQQVHEIKSSLILQPGPAALTDGLDALTRIIQNWQRQHG